MNSERKIERIIIVPLSEQQNELRSVQDALEFLDSLHPGIEYGETQKYQIYVTCSNNDRLQAEFRTKINARNFLKLIS